MKKTVKTEKLIRILQDARKRSEELEVTIGGGRPYVSTINLMVGMFMRELGLKPGTLEANRFLTRVWGLKAVKEVPNIVSKVTQGMTLQSISDLRALAMRACTCDGGNTNGCSACVAERKLQSLGVKS